MRTGAPDSTAVPSLPPISEFTFSTSRADGRLETRSDGAHAALKRATAARRISVVAEERHELVAEAAAEQRTEAADAGGLGIARVRAVPVGREVKVIEVGVAHFA